MGRLKQLKKTYIKNIEDCLFTQSTSTDIQLEFILLNWNSQDGLDKWVEKNLKKYIDDGLVKYFKTDFPTHFEMARTKNITSIYACGDIICNLDADNYLGEGFAKWVIDQLKDDTNIILRPSYGVLAEGEAKEFRGSSGRICMTKDLFMKTGGYDEEMGGWGYEDIDICERAIKAYNTKLVDIPINFLSTEPHSATVRGKNLLPIKINKKPGTFKVYDGALIADNKVRNNLRIVTSNNQATENWIKTQEKLYPNKEIQDLTSLVNQSKSEEENTIRMYRNYTISMGKIQIKNYTGPNNDYNWGMLPSAKAKISFITTCCNRAEFVKQTLCKNIENSLSYADDGQNMHGSKYVEFILLNWNSPDDLDTFVKENLQVYIDMGLLKYYHTTHPKYFYAARAKNTAHRLATGDILCNIDADNFIGKGFAEYVNKTWQENGPHVLMVREDMGEPDKPPWGGCGRLVYGKHHFQNMGGYNEKLTYYAWDDIDIYLRFKQLYPDAKVIEIPKKYIKIIEHDHDIRISNFRNCKLSHHDSMMKNKAISDVEISRGELTANFGKLWGRLPQEEELVVAFAANNKFFTLLETAIYSLYLCTGSKYLIYIIDNGIDPINRENLIKKVREEYDWEIEWVYAKDHWDHFFQGEPQFDSHYSRLIIPHLVPKTIKKILYLDCDILVRGNILELWNIDIGDNVVGAANDPIIRRFDHPYHGVFANLNEVTKKELNLKGDSPYFNSGVLLINVERWILEGITEKVIEISLKYSGFRYWDQWGLNIVLKDKWFDLGVEWNCPPRLAQEVPKRECENPSIIHYVGDIKPFNLDYWCFDEWGQDRRRFHLEFYCKYLIADSRNEASPKCQWREPTGNRCDNILERTDFNWCGPHKHEAETLFFKQIQNTNFSSMIIWDIMGMMNDCYHSKDHPTFSEYRLCH